MSLTEFSPSSEGGSASGGNKGSTANLLSGGEVPRKRGGGVGAAGRGISPNKGSTAFLCRRGV